MTSPPPSSAENPRHVVPPSLMMACFALLILHVAFFPAAWLGHWWIIDDNGLGIPTDFVNVWSAGKLALQGHAALAYDWAIQKQLQISVLGQSYPGNFAWHYPPPFLFVAATLASFPYVAAYMAWPLISFVPFALVMRGLVGRPFGWLLAAAFPVVLVNTLIGQNGFLTAALVGGTLYLLPIRPVLSGICLGLLSYKPQYGLLFPLVLVVARQWAVFVTAGAVAALMSIASLAVFGTEAWLAWWNWLPMASQAFLSEGRAPWGKMQSIFATVRFFDGTEHFAWICQWTMTALVACALVALWRSRVRYSIKAAGLATGTLLATPYLFLYDVMVLAIPVALMIRVGLKSGFRNYELPALGIILALLFIYPVIGAPTGFAATLIMAAMVAGRAGLFGVVETNEQAAPQKLPQLQT